MRLGHVGELAIKKQSQMDGLGKDHVSKLEFCENCVLGKSTKV